jgi:hypothetical protein
MLPVTGGEMSLLIWALLTLGAGMGMMFLVYLKERMSYG